MKAISLWEPWASLIRTGAKSWETRPWRTHYQGELLICAAKVGLPKYELIHKMSFWSMQGGLAPLVDEPLDLTFKSWPGVGWEDLNFGNAVAIVELVYCKRTDDMTLAEIEIEKHFGNFSLGRYAWKLRLIDGSFKPFQVKGGQGFFYVPDKVIKNAKGKGNEKI